MKSFYRLMASFLALTLNQAAFAQTAQRACKDLKIFSIENNASEFIKITPTQKKAARFEICNYQDPKYCRQLGPYTEYKTTELTYKKYAQYVKGGTMVALELGAIAGISFITGGFAYLMTGGIKYGTPAYALVNINTGYAVSAITAGVSAYAISSTNILNPMNHFRNGVAMSDLKDAILEEKCAISVEHDEKTMIERMEALMENFETAEVL